MRYTNFAAQTVIVVFAVRKSSQYKLAILVGTLAIVGESSDGHALSDESHRV